MMSTGELTDILRLELKKARAELAALRAENASLREAGGEMYEALRDIDKNSDSCPWCLAPTDNHLFGCLLEISCEK